MLNNQMGRFLNQFIGCTKNHVSPLGATAILATFIATFLIYFPGLAGPLVLDDNINLRDITHYLEGNKTALAVITDNQSGRLGRPVSMASFVLDAYLWGDSTWHAKRSSLLLHLATGALVLLLFWLLLRRTPHLDRHAGKLAVLLAALWLLVPIHVSTVLYLIQRMAQLSAFFMLAGLCWFVLMREAIDSNRRWGSIGLWIGLPAFTMTAAFSKENGLLLPLLASVVELAWFRPPPSEKRPRSVSSFFLVLAILAFVGVLLMLTRAESFFSDYVLRDFSLYERLLTQARILWEYVVSILIPTPSTLGLFRDQYPISTGLLEPPATLLAILAWLGVILSAWRWRDQFPAFSGGVGLFLVSHSMESSIFPLELYFEHRNYLASVGLLLAVAGLVGPLASNLPSTTRSFRITGTALILLIPIVLAMNTLNRVQAWTTTDSFYAHQLRHHPDSPRLRSYLLGFALNQANFSSAMMHINAAERAFDRPGMPAPIYWRFLAYCAIDEPPPDSLYQELEKRHDPIIAKVDMLSWELLSQKIEANDCPGLNPQRLAAAVQEWLDNTDLPDDSINVWRSRYSLARLLAALGEFEHAAEVGRRTWEDANYNRGVGIFLFQVNATLRNEQACREIFKRLKRSEGQGDLRFDRAVQTFRDALATGLQELPSKNEDSFLEEAEGI